MKKLECLLGKNDMFHNLFKPKPKVEFFSLLPEVVDIQPIIPACEYKPAWWSNAQKDFVEQTKHENFGKEKFTHTVKCPGIFNLIRHGWILKTWQDITIKTNGDKQTFEWTSSSSYGDDVVGFNPKDQLSDFYGGWNDSLNCVIKINTPWRCIVPKGYYLFENSVPYSDDTHFTTLPGFYSQEYGVAQINVQLKWKATNDYIKIPAGTPIAHYMLIPQEHYSMVALPASNQQKYLDHITNIEIEKRFVSDKGKSKCIFARLFK